MRVIGASAPEWHEACGDVDAAARACAPFVVFSSGLDVVAVIGQDGDTVSDVMRVFRSYVPEAGA